MDSGVLDAVSVESCLVLVELLKLPLHIVRYRLTTAETSKITTAIYTTADNKTEVDC